MHARQAGERDETSVAWGSCEEGANGAGTRQFRAVHIQVLQRSACQTVNGQARGVQQIHRDGYTWVSGCAVLELPISANAAGPAGTAGYQRGSFEGKHAHYYIRMEFDNHSSPSPCEDSNVSIEASITSTDGLIRPTQACTPTLSLIPTHSHEESSVRPSNALQPYWHALASHEG